MLNPIKAAAPKLALAVYCLLTLVASQGFRSDELECEEALVQLDDCCPTLDISDIGCFYSEAGCGSDVIRPLISERDAECIKKLSCTQLRDRDVCERVADAHAGRTTGASNSSGGSNGDLCL